MGQSRQIIISINISLQIQSEEGIAVTELKGKFEWTVNTTSINICL